ncbi:MAG: hypothetical protein ACYS5W_20230, partial [Planctomycetota bacterium]
MRSTSSRILGTILALAALATPAAAQDKGVPNWCEVEVDLGKNGRSSITYTVQYKILRRNFHGFYFSGPQIDDLKPVWDRGWGKATHSSGREYRIHRGRRNGKGTIELAGGAAVHSGTVNFRFRFATDL